MTGCREQIFDAILGREGGYAGHPDDRGGPTRWGITQAVARAHGYAGDMRSLPRQTAMAILTADYWTGPGFDRVAEISPAIAAELCDTGVNMGPAVAVRFLQRWLTAFNGQGSRWPDLVPDGQAGPRTLCALRAFLAARGREGEAVLLCALNCSQGQRYLELAGQRPANESFLYGWMKTRVRT